MRVLFIDCSEGVSRENLEGALGALAGQAGGARELVKVISPDRVIASPIGMGRAESGALGALKGAIVCGREGAEVTREGAEDIMAIADEFGDMPEMSLLNAGECDRARAYLGETREENAKISLLSCNMDDITAEALSFAVETLFREGARDVYTVAAGMKKSRQGVVLNCVCKKSDADRLAKAILRHTTTLGVREIECTARALDRHVRKVETEYGSVRMKLARGEGVKRAKPEYEDAARLAEQSGATFEEITRAAYRALENEEGSLK